MSFGDAWIGVLSYTLQIYFDFSGHTDMAIGLARLFGIHLPINFESPYKAASIIDFWRRWHMTLSRFLREYGTALRLLSLARMGCGGPARVTESSAGA